MLRNLLVIVVLLICPASLFAGYSNDELKKGVYLELFGSSYTYSFNYEHFLYKDPNMAITGRIGAGYLPPEKYLNSWNAILGMNLLLGSETHYVETGLAYLSLYHDESRQLKHYTSFYMGYRFQLKPNGLMLRAGLTPYYTPYDYKLSYEEIPLTLYGGISVGYSF